MAKQDIKLNALESFIKTKLRSKLKTDLINHRIHEEGDLQCCAYYHLRQYLRGSKRWYLGVNRQSPFNRYFVDLLVLEVIGPKTVVPRIAIELKWNRREIARKDRRSLNQALDAKRFNLHKGYFIVVFIGKGKYKKAKKTSAEKQRLIEVVVQLSRKEMNEWKKGRRYFWGKEMRQGKRAARRNT